jgi:SAM-dependent methyltransferase
MSPTGGTPERRRLQGLRSRLARMALVYEERDREARDRHREVTELEERITARFERDVRPFAELRAELERVQRENAAVLRLVSEAKEGGPGLERPPSNRLSRGQLFEEIEWGGRDDLKAKVSGYVELFRGHEPIVDLGCGRGEFIELAAQSSLAAYGIDSDPAALADGQRLGLDLRQGELFEHLAGLAEASMGGVFCSQVVEHLPPELIPRLMEEIARVLDRGGVTVVVTANPATFSTHVQSFWRDPTHIRPVPDVSLAFAARTAGLMVREVVYSSWPPESERLHRIDVHLDHPEVIAVAERTNAVIDKLNHLLYGPEDYAVVAVKPA